MIVILMDTHNKRKTNQVLWCIYFSCFNLKLFLPLLFVNFFLLNYKDTNYTSMKIAFPLLLCTDVIINSNIFRYFHSFFFSSCEFFSETHVETKRWTLKLKYNSILLLEWVFFPPFFAAAVSSLLKENFCTRLDDDEKLKPCVCCYFDYKKNLSVGISSLFVPATSFVIEVCF